MPGSVSSRLMAIVDALPLEPGTRVLEIGCGPGAMAREIARRLERGHILAIDRSAKAIARARAASSAELAAGRLRLRCIAHRRFELEPDEAPFDIAVPIRVRALDGRYAESEEKAHRRIAAALTSRGRLFVECRGQVREIPFRARATP